MAISTQKWMQFVLLIAIMFEVLCFQPPELITDHHSLEKSVDSYIHNGDNAVDDGEGELVTILSDEIVFRGYGDIVRRTVRLPNHQLSVSDLWIAKHTSVVIFVWDSQSSTTTLIREYHPGPNKFLYGTVAGMYEYHKHDSTFTAAKAELAEEAQMETDQWVPLLDSLETEMPYDKYSNHKFVPFLAIDCRRISSPRPMDHDEYITVERNVSMSRVLALMGAGAMNVVSTYTTLLAMQKLRAMHLLGATD